MLVYACLLLVAGVLGAPQGSDVSPDRAIDPGSTGAANLTKVQFLPSTVAPAVIQIVSQSEEHEPNGTYKFSFETANGIKREEIAYDKTVPAAQARNNNVGNVEGGNIGDGSGSEGIHVQEGSFSYSAPDGTLISVRYTADENGFRPIGDHIPTGAPIQASVLDSRGSESDSQPSIQSRISQTDSQAGASENAAAKVEALSDFRPEESTSEAASTSTDAPVSKTSDAGSTARQVSEEPRTTASRASSRDVYSSDRSRSSTASNASTQANGESSPLSTATA